MIVNCVVYRQGQKLADIPPSDISDYVAQPDALVWVALADPTREEIALMAEEFGLHPLAYEDACKGHQRPKIEEYEDSLFVVLHTFDPDPANPDEMVCGEVHVFIGPNYVLSLRHHTQKGFAEVRARTEREPELLRFGSGYVLYALMDAVVDRYFPIIDTLSSDLERIEAALFEPGSSRQRIQELYGLKRRLMNLDHAVAPMLEAVGKLHGGRVPRLVAGMNEYYRDVYDHLARIQAAVDSNREMLQTAISVNIALISLSDNEVTKRLAAWGALITVPTLIAGIYGMNFKFMPELSWVAGYPFALALMIGIDAVLFMRFRRAGWV